MKFFANNLQSLQISQHEDRLRGEFFVLSLFIEFDMNLKLFLTFNKYSKRSCSEIYNQLSSPKIELL